MVFLISYILFVPRKHTVLFTQANENGAITCFRLLILSAGAAALQVRYFTGQDWPPYAFLNIISHTESDRI